MSTVLHLKFLVDRIVFEGTSSSPESTPESTSASDSSCRDDDPRDGLEFEGRMRSTKRGQSRMNYQREQICLPIPFSFTARSEAEKIVLRRNRSTRI